MHGKLISIEEAASLRAFWINPGGRFIEIEDYSNSPEGHVTLGQQILKSLGVKKAMSPTDIYDTLFSKGFARAVQEGDELYIEMPTDIGYLGRSQIKAAKDHAIENQLSEVKWEKERSVNPSTIWRESGLTTEEVEYLNSLD